MEAPFIVIFGLHISEPMTLITDYIIAVMGICFWKRLFDIESSQKNVARNLWAICFLILSFAAFLGGTHHGFSYYLTPALNKAIWQITVYSTGVISFLFVTGTATFFSCQDRKNLELDCWCETIDIFDLGDLSPGLSLCRKRLSSVDDCDSRVLGYCFRKREECFQYVARCRSNGITYWCSFSG